MIEQEIILACYGEFDYNRIKFLEESDFSDKNWGVLWGLLEKFNGNTIDMVAQMELDKKTDYIEAIRKVSTGMGSTRLVELALKLVELRFKRLYRTLIGKTLEKINNPLEVKLLTEIGDSINDNDIFELSDASIDYIGSQCSDYTKERITAFLKYRDERIKKIRDYLNN